MKQKLILLLIFLASMQVYAETSLVVYPLFGEEEATALSRIGYVQLRNDSMFLFSKTDILLGERRLSDVRKVIFEDVENPATDTENTSFSSLLVFPNPTKESLIIKNADCTQARIFGLDGQLLTTTLVQDGNTTIDVSNLPQGTYLLQLNTSIIKFIKQ